ncbi:MAG: hypothetical protein ACI9QN_002287, partial [Arcticibacterium sp.]
MGISSEFDVEHQIETVAKGRHYDFRFLYYEFSVEFSSFLTSFQS